MTTVYLKTSFPAAHRLMTHNGPCINIHGHTYYVEATITGEPDKKSGMLIDFGVIKNMIKDIFDHTLILNSQDIHVINFANSMKFRTRELCGEPSVENIAKYINAIINGYMIAHNIKSSNQVTVWESDKTSATFPDEIN